MLEYNVTNNTFSLQYIGGGTWLKCCYSNKTFMIMELLVCAFCFCNTHYAGHPKDFR